MSKRPFFTKFVSSLCLAVIALSAPLSTQALSLPDLSSTLQNLMDRKMSRLKERQSQQDSDQSSSAQSSSRSSRSRNRLTAPSSSRSSAPSNSGGQAETSGLRQEILDLVNAERRKAGVSPLTYNTTLERAAQGHAEDMRANNYFAHEARDGRSPTQRMKDAGYSCTGCSYAYGENIAEGQRSPAEAMHDWMNSPGHRRNILSTSFKEIGIGIDGYYWVQNFGALNSR